MRGSKFNILPLPPSWGSMKEKNLDILSFFLFNFASIKKYMLRELQSLKGAKTNNFKVFILVKKRKKNIKKKYMYNYKAKAR